MASFFFKSEWGGEKGGGENFFDLSGVAKMGVAEKKIKYLGEKSGVTKIVWRKRGWRERGEKKLAVKQKSNAPPTTPLSRWETHLRLKMTFFIIVFVFLPISCGVLLIFYYVFG